MITRESGKVDYDVDDIRNLNPACRVCNKWKTVWNLEEFRREIAEQVDRLKLRSSNFRMALKYGLVTETETPVTFHFEKRRP